ncbi:MAG: rhodanese-like domain-containing protein [Candidatus Viridilinea halotolerans]|uniref:Rhodanese-like domain-containing protein n=1 Tax=Candidatus Viridilinea halotolerans TaxID=2491704 RepID=A0A426TUX5_9CHLR|nr:MAG: rhodanese-like domain-containing protein [Candidatus Viridilinea halotolerans]
MPTTIRLLALLFMTLLLAACSGTAATPARAPLSAQPSFNNMTVQELKTTLDNGEPMLVLDVRTPAEYANDGHIAGSLLIPVDELPSRLAEVPSDQPIACFCRSGNRSETACGMLAQAGYSNLHNVEGGIRAWRAAGYPFE